MRTSKDSSSSWLQSLIFVFLVPRMGGIPAVNGRGERLLLFIGIIDILQSYRYSTNVSKIVQVLMYLSKLQVHAVIYFRESSQKTYVLITFNVQKIWNCESASLAFIGCGIVQATKSAPKKSIHHFNFLLQCELKTKWRLASLTSTVLKFIAHCPTKHVLGGGEAAVWADIGLFCLPGLWRSWSTPGKHWFMTGWVCVLVSISYHSVTPDCLLVLHSTQGAAPAWPLVHYSIESLHSQEVWQNMDQIPTNVNLIMMIQETRCCFVIYSHKLKPVD